MSMSQTMSLKELKLQNAESEEVQADDVTIEEPETEVETEEEGEQEEHQGDDTTDDDDGETDPDGEDEPEIEEWMKGSDTPSNDKSVPLSKHIQVRSDLKTKLRDSDAEKEELRRRLDELEKQFSSGTAPQAKQEGIAPPNIEDFYDDYGELKAVEFNAANQKYQEALIDSRLNGRDQQAEAERKMAERQAEIDSSVNRHYELAEKLVSGGKLKAEDYQRADSAIVTYLDSIEPGHGTTIAKGLINHIHKVSERPAEVWYKLGVDNVELNEVIKAYQKGEAEGIAKLAKLSRKFETGNRKISKAPKPAVQPNGDKSESPSALEKRYKLASKKGDVQTRISIKREAKRQGVDTSNW